MCVFLIVHCEGAMGNHPSNHQPLERPNVGKFGDLQTVGAAEGAPCFKKTNRLVMSENSVAL